MQSNELEEPRPARAVCGATKRSGERCQTAPMANGRCRMHGGATPLGIASANFKHGRYSKAVPALAVRYQEALTDPEVLQLNHELALLDARIGQVLERVESGESGARWKEVQTAFNTWSKTRGSKDEAAAAAVLEEAIVGGRSDMAAWEDVRAMLQERRKLVSAELKRIQVAQKHMSYSEAMALAARLSEAVKRHVTDDDTLRAISREFASIAR